MKKEWGFTFVVAVFFFVGCSGAPAKNEVSTTEETTSAPSDPGELTQDGAPAKAGCTSCADKAECTCKKGDGAEQAECTCKKGDGGEKAGCTACADKAECTCKKGDGGEKAGCTACADKAECACKKGVDP